MKVINWIIGCASLGILLFVGLSEWEFREFWFPFVLMNLVSLSMLFEIFRRIKGADKRFVWGIILLVVFTGMIFVSEFLATIGNHRFLLFSTTVYENSELVIEQAVLIKRRPESPRQFTLLEKKWNGLLIRKLEEVEVIDVTGCEVYFSKKNSIFDYCKKKFYP